MLKDKAITAEEQEKMNLDIQDMNDTFDTIKQVEGTQGLLDNIQVPVIQLPNDEENRKLTEFKDEAGDKIESAFSALD